MLLAEVSGRQKNHRMKTGPASHRISPDCDVGISLACWGRIASDETTLRNRYSQDMFQGLYSG